MRMRTLRGQAIACVLALAGALTTEAAVLAPPPPPFTVTPVNAGLRLASPGIAVPGAIQARVTNNSDGSPAVGVQVEFLVRATGPTIHFGGGFTFNGISSIDATTDASGIASINGVANFEPGLVEVTAEAGASGVIVAALVIPGPLQIVNNWSGRYAFGDVRSLDYRIVAPWFPCQYASAARDFFAGGVTTVSANGISLPTTLDAFNFCDAGGTYSLFASTDVSALLPGHYDLDALYAAPNDLGLLEARSTLTVDPDVTVAAAQGAGPFQAALGWTVSDTAEGTCSSVTGVAGRAGDAGFPSTTPPGLDTPAGLLRLDATNCGWGPVFDMLPVGTLVQQALLGTGSALPAGTTVWAWGPSADNPQPHWYALPTSLSGTFAKFDLVDGGAGDNSIGQDGSLHALLALGQPHATDYSRGMQDLWWAGPQENGWGLSLTQHGDRLFAGLFIYDAAGAPTWVVMSSGTWNAARTQYTGSLYRPHGTPFNAYDATQLSVGPAVGTLKLTFTSRDTLTLDYTVDGVSGRKSMQRQLFGPVDPFYAPAVSDLWWGGSGQNGWGLALAQQYSTAFGVLFTYDANGSPVWFALPALRGSRRFLASPVYRTQGSAWLGVPYDASRFSATNMGTATLTFNATEAFLSYTIGGITVQQGLSRQPF